MPKAIGYRVELFRGEERVFSRRTAEPLLALPRRWTYEGHGVTLDAGTYRWVVWPVFRDGVADVAVVQASLSIG